MLLFNYCATDRVFPFSAIEKIHSHAEPPPPPPPTLLTIKTNKKWFSFLWCVLGHIPLGFSDFIKTPTEGD